MTSRDWERCQFQGERICKCLINAGFKREDIHFSKLDLPRAISFWAFATDGRRVDFPGATSVEELEKMSDAAIEERIRSVMFRR